MRAIGIRELKASLSGVLDKVEGGEPIRVTKRGRPVADIVPATAGRRSDERLRTLASEGSVTLPTRPLPGRAPRLVRAARSASEIVLAERDEER
jgi:prevent-host-death family protein